jgi:hypothetical protein
MTIIRAANALPNEIAPNPFNSVDQVRLDRMKGLAYAEFCRVRRGLNLDNEEATKSVG